MRFKFKVQDYQTDAVESVVSVFKGQTKQDYLKYIKDLGTVNQHKVVTEDDNFQSVEQVIIGDVMEVGYKNDYIQLTNSQLLQNINKIQSKNNIKLSEKLVKDIGRCSIDIEMETGTGKTYTYIKTIFELNKYYGWSKFIVVVPSIAIREGVYKTFQITSEHFMEHYGKKPRFFIYNSSKLKELESYSSNQDISVMIINTQSFATSLKEGAKNKESRIIYSKRDDFGSRRPIDVISANNPIIILDEPQKMGGDVTQKALKNFNPLFCLNYSATHAKKHNLVYVLDALDSFNKKIVKKIEVKGFEVDNLTGIHQYMYLDDIILSKTKPPTAKIEIEVNQNQGYKRKVFNCNVGDDLFYKSNELEQYKEGFIVAEIEPLKSSITFTNGLVLQKGQVVGDVVEKDIRRIQIRETIKSHFEKEEELFNKGIKTLSLFFIDEVSKYRQYDEEGNELLGEYGKIFEEEYENILGETISNSNSPYQKYLSKISVENTHKGYFSIDKKGRIINSSLKRGYEYSDDISAYDLILKNKERLLSFDEPTRFIFSHSALREGWDNPNVFQICTLKHSDSSVQKRQEVGRGLRICVNQDGDRMDYETCGDLVHDINKLTVIASESYKNFVEDLQSEIKKVLHDRPTKATKEYFEGKIIDLPSGEEIVIDKVTANKIQNYLESNDYVDEHGNVSDKYKSDLSSGNLEKLPDELEELTEGIHKLIGSIFDESLLEEMTKDGNKAKIVDNGLNDNFYKKEFQTLWNYINDKYSYTVSFDSDELIKKSIDSINSELFVSILMYKVLKGEQKDEIKDTDIHSGTSFEFGNMSTNILRNNAKSKIKYDLIGKIAKETLLTRKSVAQILKNISKDKFDMFKQNPEEFIIKVIKLINNQKSTMIVEHISYDKTNEKYDSTIFTSKKDAYADNGFYAKKHIQDFVITDGISNMSVERKFVQDLEDATEVCVYAKLPRGFKIPTPVGNYSPDWAIAFNEGTVKHIYFVAETKGTMDSLNLRPIEQAKISCAKKLFNKISTSNVKYHDVKDYKTLLTIIESL